MQEYFPDLENFRELSKIGNVVPVYKEIPAFNDDPVSAYLKIREGKYSFLFESVEGGEKWARYSFFGNDPLVILRSKNAEMEVIRGNERELLEVSDPFEFMKKFMSTYHLVRVEGLPRFCGGAVGYISYDAIRFVETLPQISNDDLDLPDLFFMLTRSMVIFDNSNNSMKIVSNAFLDDESEDPYKDALDSINTLVDRLIVRKSFVVNFKENDNFAEDEEFGLNDEFSSSITSSHFKDSVRKIVELINEGEAIQVVLSQRLERELHVDPFSLYCSLRRVNPSPYMFFLTLDEIILVGASPEVLVRLEEQTVEVRPIAGTRKRGMNEKEDIELEKELLADEKEIAEHIMLLDLGRNDIGRICIPGTVNVTEKMVIERYSHVMHIVSNVSGKIAGDKDAFDVIRATFPAGTVSGAPKVRAMEIIEEIEPVRRGPYAGAVGYFGFDGNMDTCIAIRTVYIKNEKIYLQVGAGIVSDSKPNFEFEETINKAKGMLRAIQVAKGALIEEKYEEE